MRQTYIVQPFPLVGQKALTVRVCSFEGLQAGTRTKQKSDYEKLGGGGRLIFYLALLSIALARKEQA